MQMQGGKRPKIYAQKNLKGEEGMSLWKIVLRRLTSAQSKHLEEFFSKK
jgi:hypothetical protein